MRLFDEEPAFLRGVSEGAAARLRAQSLAEARLLARGPWVVDGDPSLERNLIGLLILDGVLVRRIAVDSRQSAELLGAGDLVNPAIASDDYATIQAKASWQALTEVRFAILDADLVAGLSMLSSFTIELADKAIRRSRELGLRLAIAQVRSLEDRLELLLWHLADRWGRRMAGAVVLSFVIPQGLLAELVAAQRTSVNAALQQLVARGVLATTDDGRWRLLKEPPMRLLEASPKRSN